MQNIDESKVNRILLFIIIFLQVITISIVVICSDCYKNSDDLEELANDTITLNDTDNEEISMENSTIKVDVKGAVKEAGVYELSVGTRVIDAINMAGGLKSSASTKYLNLSKKITDEMIIYVYTTTQVKNMNIVEEVKNECICPSIDCSSCAGSSIINSDSNDVFIDDSLKDSNDGKISINSASKEELMTLSGIGEAKALEIIKYRTENNGFKSIEEIMNVSGIGEAAYNKIKDFIKL
ncbi:MAG: helix-hairpin-helix domain-containing protein [Candidatus Coprovivens sp.]